MAKSKKSLDPDKWLDRVGKMLKIIIDLLILMMMLQVLQKST